MNHRPDQKLESAMRRAVPPVRHDEMPRDIWPALQHVIEKDRRAFPWTDAALAIAATLWFAFFPEAISIMLMHL
jgi:hypothetical protein